MWQSYKSIEMQVFKNPYRSSSDFTRRWRANWSRIASRNCSSRILPSHRNAEQAIQQPCTRCALSINARITSSNLQPWGRRCIIWVNRQTMRELLHKRAWTQRSTNSCWSLLRSCPFAASPAAHSMFGYALISVVWIGHKLSRYTVFDKDFKLPLFAICIAEWCVRLRMKGKLSDEIFASSSSQLSSSSTCFRYACECNRKSTWRSVSRRLIWTWRGISLVAHPYSSGRIGRSVLPGVVLAQTSSALCCCQVLEKYSVTLTEALTEYSFL